MKTGAFFVPLGAIKERVWCSDLRNIHSVNSIRNFLDAFVSIIVIQPTSGVFHISAEV